MDIEDIRIEILHIENCIGNKCAQLRKRISRDFSKIDVENGARFKERMEKRRMQKADCIREIDKRRRGFKEEKFIFQPMKPIFGEWRRLQVVFGEVGRNQSNDEGANNCLGAEFSKTATMSGGRGVGEASCQFLS